MSKDSSMQTIQTAFDQGFTMSDYINDQIVLLEKSNPKPSKVKVQNLKNGISPLKTNQPTISSGTGVINKEKIRKNIAEILPM